MTIKKTWFWLYLTHVRYLLLQLDTVGIWHVCTVPDIYWNSSLLIANKCFKLGKAEFARIVSFCVPRIFRNNPSELSIFFFFFLLVINFLLWQTVQAAEKVSLKSWSSFALHIALTAHTFARCLAAEWNAEEDRPIHCSHKLSLVFRWKKRKKMKNLC